MKKLLLPSVLLFCFGTAFTQQIKFKEKNQKLVRYDLEQKVYPVMLVKAGELNSDAEFILAVLKNTAAASYVAFDGKIIFPGRLTEFPVYIEVPKGISPLQYQEKEDTVVLQLIYDQRTDLDTIYIQHERILAQPAAMENNFDNERKIELMQFTDFLGFENDRPNGIYQQEFRFKWPLVKRWWPTYPSSRKNGKERQLYVQFFRSIVVPDVLFNRIDKAGKDVNYPYGKTVAGNGSTHLDSVRPYLTTMDIVKYSSMQISARIIPLALKIRNTRIQLQYSFTIFRNRPYIADTIFVGPDSSIRTSGEFRPVYSFGQRIEVFIKSMLNGSKDINIIAVAGVMWLRLKDGYYKQFDAAMIDPLNQATTLLPIGEAVKREVTPIWYYSTRLSKQLGENKKNDIFLRFNYSYQKGEYNRVVQKASATQPVRFERSTFHNHFLQIQAGFTLDVEEIFKKG